MAKLALYRKYRPTSFNELYGQEHIAKTLRNAVREHTFSHAYLFTGTRGTGKTSSARLLAKAINCLDSKDGNPCNKCEHCQLVNSGRAMDIIEIDAASHTQVDNIREVIVERAKFAPTKLAYKVYIIDEAHMLSKSSFNALLKTLEEPPAHTIFILATTEPHKIIETIRSRCQRFDFKKIDVASLKKRLAEIAKLEKIEAGDPVIELIAAHSDGGFRDAISLLDKAADYSGGKPTEEEVLTMIGAADDKTVERLVGKILAKDTAGAIETLEEIASSGVESQGIYRSILVSLQKRISSSLNSADGGLAELVALSDQIVAAFNAYRYQPIPTLGLEIAVIKYTENIAPTPSTKKPSQSATKTPETEVSEKTIAKTPSNLSNQAKWQQFLLEVKSKNNSVHAILKACQPVLTEKEAILNFPYKFHKERIEDRRNLDLINSLLTKVYGHDLVVKCVLKPMVASQHRTEEARPVVKDDLLDEAIDIFGGEIIE